MNLFIKRIAIFLSPFIIYIIIVLYLDPFNVIYKNDRLTQLKVNISSKINYPLYKIQNYKNDPKEILLLGDSRTDNLMKFSKGNSYVDDISNVAYGGGTLAEIIDTFWYITKKHKIKKVYIGINFNLFNDKIDNNRVTEATALRESIPSYMFSKYTFRATHLILQSLLRKETIAIEKPKMSREEFWNFQLTSSASYYYNEYVHPDFYIRRLTKIADYCKKNNIELQFIIPPTHIDLQNRITDFNLVEEVNIFRNTLNQLGKTYDFDYPNELTNKKTNFLDPFHFNDSIAAIIMKEITTNHIKYARLE